MHHICAPLGVFGLKPRCGQELQLAQCLHEAGESDCTIYRQKGGIFPVTRLISQSFRVFSFNYVGEVFQQTLGHFTHFGMKQPGSGLMELCSETGRKFPRQAVESAGAGSDFRTSTDNSV